MRLRIGIAIIILFSCSVIALGAQAADQLFEDTAPPPPAPTAYPILISAGIEITQRTAREVIGPGPANIFLSPEETPYHAAVYLDSSGIRNFSLPREVSPELSWMATDEKQEYVLRILVACGSCIYDTSTESPGTVAPHKTTGGDAAVHKYSWLQPIIILPAIAGAVILWAIVRFITDYKP